MRQKCIATVPGLPDKYVDFTAAEEIARDAEELDAAKRPEPVPRFESEALIIEANTTMEAATKAALAKVIRTV